MAKLDFKGIESQKEALFKEVEEMAIPTPSSSIEFSMMQKLFAYWVKKKHFYGNWSGTGVGKTYSFILASRVIDAHMTVVIGTNSTTNQLASEITELYSVSPRESAIGELSAMESMMAIFEDTLGSLPEDTTEYLNNIIKNYYHNATNRALIAEYDD